MTSWTNHIAPANDCRKWALIARIEGLGPYLTSAELAAAGGDDRYRFCVEAPAYAAAHPAGLWRPYLRDVPDLLSEEGDLLGGVQEDRGALQLAIVDYEDLLTDQLRVDAAAVATIATAIDDEDLAITMAAATAGIGSADVAYVGAEALRIVTRFLGVLTLTRGALGTDPVPHAAGDRIYAFSPFIIGRRVQIHVAPLDGESADDERLVAEYVIDSFKFSRDTNTWIFSGDSQARYLDRIVPRAPRAWVLASVAEDQASILVDPLDPVGPRLQWPLNQGDPLGRDILLETDDGEVLAVANDPSSRKQITGRGLFGTPVGELKPGTKLTQVFCGGRPHIEPDDPASFRFYPNAPAGLDVFDMGDAEWVKTANWVDLVASILVSPSTPNDPLVAQAENYPTNGINYAVLPPGYGAGIPHDLIDWPSFAAVKARTVQYRFPFFRLGAQKPVAVRKLLDDELLRPMGARLVLEDGLIKLVLSRAPALNEAVESIDGSSILAEETEPGVHLPRFEVSVAGTQAGAVTYEVGPVKRAITFESGSYGDTFGQAGAYSAEGNGITIPVPGADPDEAELLFGPRAAARLLRVHRPAMQAAADVDMGVGWSATVGAIREVTIGGVPNLAGGRGWTSKLVEILQREIDADLDEGVFARLRMLAYGDGFRVGLIAPAARIESIAGDPTFSVTQNVYTSSDADTAALPDHDLGFDLQAGQFLLFESGDVVKLIEADGTDVAGAGLETVTGVDPGAGQLELSDNFNGEAAVGRIIVPADFDDASPRQRGLFAFLSDRSTLSVGASAVHPFVYGET